MSIQFVRLPEGRLWHVAHTPTTTMCDRPTIPLPTDPRGPETLTSQVPAGAWVCDRCVREVARWLAAAQQALAGDPRQQATLPEEGTDP